MDAKILLIALLVHAAYSHGGGGRGRGGGHGGGDSEEESGFGGRRRNQPTLSCYGCTNCSAAAVANVTSTITCRGRNPYCGTVAVSGRSHNRTNEYIRYCTDGESCTNGSFSFGSMTTETSCCNTPDCNSQDISTVAQALPGQVDCFECVNCPAPLNTQQTLFVSCPGVCVTMTTSFNLFFGTKTVVSRGCHSECNSNVTSSLLGKFEGLVENVNQTCCTGKLCNSA